MHLSSVLAFLATAHAGLTSPNVLRGRAEEQTKCDRPDVCEYSYTTGSAQCQTGFMRHHLEIPRYPSGSYCERDCTADERAKCTANKCNLFENDCNQYPGSGPLCASAIRWCDGPVAMLKTVCKSQEIGQTVTYDEETHLCLPDGKTADSRQAKPLRLGPGAVFNADIYDPTLYRYTNMRCSGISYPDTKALAGTAANATEGCTTQLDIDQGNTGYDVFNIKCKSPQDKRTNVETVLRTACLKFKPFQQEGQTRFSAGGFSGQPK